MSWIKPLNPTYRIRTNVDAIGEFQMIDGRQVPHGGKPLCYKDTPVETGFRKPHFMAKSIFVAVWIYPTAGHGHLDSPTVSKATAPYGFAADPSAADNILNESCPQGQAFRCKSQRLFQGHRLALCPGRFKTLAAQRQAGRFQRLFIFAAFYRRSHVLEPAE